MFQRIFHVQRLLLSILILTCLLTIPASADSLPDGFVRLNQFIPDATYDVRYYNGHNFVGVKIDGYTAPVVIITIQAATALKQVQTDLKPFNLGLKIFDGYRPQKAVDHFARWAKDINDTRTKPEFYPDVDKRHLFRDGYIAAKSGHSRGSTVDLTIIDLTTKTELDMGTTFDFFGPKSWPDNKSMSPKVRANRALLQSIMRNNGFKHLKEEWWHFTLKNEPYTNTYFNFPIN
nr:M15 family metallopeptidase [Pseudodesulfovibrio sp.]